jgi:hypothetical protein
MLISETRKIEIIPDKFDLCKPKYLNFLQVAKVAFREIPV